MIRMSRLADYAVVLMSQIANHPERLGTAPDVAADTGVPAPTTSKVLRSLARAGLLESHRGINGGYVLTRPPAEISVAEIISAVDGPIALTACIEDAPGDCGIEPICPTRSNWQRINQAVRHALDQITLAEMAESMTRFVPAFAGEARDAEGPRHGREG